MNRLRVYFTPFELFMLKQCHVTTYAMVYNYMTWKNMSILKLHDPEIKARIYQELCAYGVQLWMELESSHAPKNRPVFVCIDFLHTTAGRELTATEKHAYRKS